MKRGVTPKDLQSVYDFVSGLVVQHFTATGELRPLLMGAHLDAEVEGRITDYGLFQPAVIARMAASGVVGHEEMMGLIRHVVESEDRYRGTDDEFPDVVAHITTAKLVVPIGGLTSESSPAEKILITLYQDGYTSEGICHIDHESRSVVVGELGAAAKASQSVATATVQTAPVRGRMRMH